MRNPVRPREPRRVSVPYLIAMALLCAVVPFASTHPEQPPAAACDDRCATIGGEHDSPGERAVALPRDPSRAPAAGAPTGCQAAPRVEPARKPHPAIGTPGRDGCGSV